MIKAVEGRIVMRVDTQLKNWHKFSNGQMIRLERDWNNLDKRHTQPLQGIVIDGGGLPFGAEILCHHNSYHDVNRVFNYGELSGEEIASGIGIFSVPEVHCYLWRESGGEWKPLKGFVIAERVFRPYVGPLLGMPPVQIKNVLFLRTGHYKNKVCTTLKAVDYPIIFQNEKGVEEQIIRARHYEDGSERDREELTGIHKQYTKMVEDGELLIGVTASKAKKLNSELLVF